MIFLLIIAYTSVHLFFAILDKDIETILIDIAILLAITITNQRIKKEQFTSSIPSFICYIYFIIFIILRLLIYLDPELSLSIIDFFSYNPNILSFFTLIRMISCHFIIVSSNQFAEAIVIMYIYGTIIYTKIKTKFILFFIGGLFIVMTLSIPLISGGKSIIGASGAVFLTTSAIIIYIFSNRFKFKNEFIKQNIYLICIIFITYEIIISDILNVILKVSSNISYPVHFISYISGILLGSVILFFEKRKEKSINTDIDENIYLTTLFKEKEEL